jgi:hypothetical protein
MTGVQNPSFRCDKFSFLVAYPVADTKDNSIHDRWAPEKGDMIHDKWPSEITLIIGLIRLYDYRVLNI